MVSETGLSRCRTRGPLQFLSLGHLHLLAVDNSNFVLRTVLRGIHGPAGDCGFSCINGSA